MSVHVREKIRLILDWFINPNHAQLIVAKQKGLFEKHELEVELIEPSNPSLPPKQVAAGQADLAISYQPELYLNLAQNLPISRIATLIASPLNTIYMRKDSGIKKISDLKGKKVGYPGYTSGDKKCPCQMLLPYILESGGLTTEEVVLKRISDYWSSDTALVNGQIDAAIGGMRNFELKAMQAKGVPGRAFYLEEHGVPAYDELILIANNQNRNAAKFARFNAALEEATLYILNHPDDSWNAYIGYKKGLDDPLNRAAWQDTLPRFALSPGALDIARYQRFGVFLKAHGLIETVPELSTYAIQPIDQ